MTWPSHRELTVEWVPSGRGSKSDRMLREVSTSVPPFISNLAIDFDTDIARLHDRALMEVTRLESAFGPVLGPLTDFLLRSESVASSKIEHIDAGWNAFARALVGGKATDAARAQLNAVESLTRLIEVTGQRSLTVGDIVAAHRSLMRHDRYEGHEAGQLRTVQNWIGGSDYSPVNALYVPPPPELVADLLDDLVAFTERSDLPVVAQAALVHAQFESIHPFTDGNGRVGRALIGAVLRRHSITQRLTVPIASVMLADTPAYFAHLDAYRHGNAAGFVEYVCHGTIAACVAAAESARNLAELPDHWMSISNPRGKSATESLVQALLDNPVIDVDVARRICGTTEASVYRAIDSLVDAGILTVVTASRRDRIWAATAVLAELEELNTRIGRRVAAGF